LEIDLKASLVHKFNIKAELKRIHKIEKEQEQVNLIRDSITMSNLVAELNRQAHKPKFVYTHFIMPHAPYIYNELGKINATTLSDEEKYIAYLKYTTIRRFNMQLNKFKVSRQRLQ
jgi:endonuclease IV